MSDRERRFRAVIFDLDEVLLAREGAWRYTVEEAVASVTGRRIDTRALAAEYRARPWRHVLSVVVDDAHARLECEELCAEMFARSGLKRLLVHEGIGMALDHVRAARVEMGAISREPHSVAVKQVQSTGLDKFLAVLAASPEGRWDPVARLEQAIAFLEYPVEACAFVSGDALDLAAAARAGFTAVGAEWAGTEPGGPFATVAVPGELAGLV
ncbi:MAG: HAD hydrolase-like protein [Dehalococcoidia bacterium]|nr:HAD hydrolase-like protein [Dehalococcoidia bacterium]